MAILNEGARMSLILIFDLIAQMRCDGMLFVGMLLKFISIRVLWGFCGWIETLRSYIKHGSNL